MHNFEQFSSLNKCSSSQFIRICIKVLIIPWNRGALMAKERLAALVKTGLTIFIYFIKISVSVCILVTFLNS